MLLLTFAAAACPFRESLAAAQGAWDNGEYATFGDRVAQVQTDLSCLEDTPLTTVAARPM